MQTIIIIIDYNHHDDYDRVIVFLLSVKISKEK